MEKIIGVILVMGAGAGLGFWAGAQYDERCRLLRTWIRILMILNTEMYQQARLFPEVLQCAASRIDDAGFTTELTALAGRVGFGGDTEVRDAWREMVDAATNRLLPAAARQALLDLGNDLGCTPRDDQQAKVTACLKRLEEEHDLADMERLRHVKLYRYLGFAAGTVMVLWFI